jgi:hypothetical protein
VQHLDRQPVGHLPRLVVRDPIPNRIVADDVAVVQMG